MTDVERTVVRRMHAAAIVCGLLAALLGLVALIGWALGAAPLQRLLPGLATMKVNTAAAVLLSGAALCLRARPALRRPATALAAAVAVLAVSSLVESWAAVDLHIDQAVYRDALTAAADHPGRPSPATAVCLACLGVALAGLDRLPRPSQALATLTLLIAALALLGYAYGTEALYHVAPFASVALHTAVALALLALGTLLARPLRLPALLVTCSRGGALARQLLPGTILVPLLVGWACLAGRNRGLYAVEFGCALFALIVTVTLAVLVWWNASLLDHADAQRQRVEADRDDLLVRERAARESAERALTARDQLLAVVSHELRTPLQPVVLIAGDLSRRGDVPGEVREDLTTILEQVQIEVGLINDLLDVVSLRQSKLTPGRDRLDANAMVRGVVESLERAFAGKGVSVAFEPAPGPATVLGDAGRLQQVVRNLLANALKFTPPGGSVRVLCSVGGGRFRTGVTDTGVGIAAEVIDRIFGEFEQADPSTTRRFGGLGLGLSIGRRLAEMHGGTVTAASDGVDRGARFCLDLPVVDAPAAAPVELAPAPAVTRPGGGRRILLVEDNLDTLALLERLLASRGYHVTAAASAREALAAVDDPAAPPFDVLVSDIGLPDLSGWDLRERLNGRAPVRSIAVSGFVTDADARRSLACGFDEHLCKPIDLHRLIAVIEMPVALDLRPQASSAKPQNI